MRSFICGKFSGAQEWRSIRSSLNLPACLNWISLFRAEAGTATRGTLLAYDTFYRELGDTVLGLIPDDLGAAGAGGAGLTEELMRLLLALRADFRTNKEWARSDAIRNELTALGIVLEDGAEGTRWRLNR